MSEKAIRVLLVDDDEQEYLLIKDLLAGIGAARYALEWVGEYADALAAVDRAEHDVYLLDYRLRGARSGLDLLREAKSRGCQAPMILLTGLTDSAIDHAALQNGAADYLVKGQFSADSFARALRYAIERSRLHDMLVQAEKLSAMGLLAAGVAHELNNPLAQIIGSCDLALSQTAPGEPVEENLRAIERASRRCRDLVKDLLVFARKEEAPPADFELNECVRAALALTEPEAHMRSVVVVRALGPEPLTVHGHKNHLEQVFVNLVNNALDAMPRGGRLTVRTGAVPAAGRRALRVDVIDTGAGISSESSEKLFEAFFTTKGPGKGTGLGLFLSRNIVAAHGGEIAVASAPGKGSTFSVTLPPA